MCIVVSMHHHHRDLRIIMNDSHPYYMHTYVIVCDYDCYFVCWCRTIQQLTTDGKYGVRFGVA